MQDLIDLRASADIAQPRALRAALRDQNRSSLQLEQASSGASTPVPPDALPSVKATSSARKQLRDQEKRKRLFPTIEYAARVSHFDPKSEYRDFRGFFVLFWIGLAIMVLSTMLRNVKETGFPFQMRHREIFLENLSELALSDLAMTASTGAVMFMHKLFARKYTFTRWNRWGMWIQVVVELAWIGYWTDWPFLRDWTWTAQVFFTLHMLTLFMKLHSYAFYNGHLSETKHRLNSLDHPETASRSAAVKYPDSRGQFHELIRLDHDLTPEDIANEKLSQLREDLAVELTSPIGNVTYPQNLTWKNFAHFICCPTLCYELEYPLTDRINWLELGSKCLAIFGCIFLLTVTSEEFIMPVLDENAVRLSASGSIAEGGLIIAETISRMLFPFMVTFLLVFLVIFEYILGASAELTRFADRHFYADWWNSCDWLEFSREWNIPVHHWFRRHVYMSSRGLASRPAATVITFLISAIMHELVMGCITKKLRGYGAFAMMLQMPIVMVQRSKWMRGHALLNNILFWMSMILGLSMLCALYVLV